MLNIKNLEAIVDNKTILKGLNLDIKPGEVHAIMGPNGSGKSTLANVLSGKTGYKIKGDIKYNGESLSKLSTEEKAQKNFFSISISFRNTRRKHKHFPENFFKLSKKSQRRKGIRHINFFKIN